MDRTRKPRQRRNAAEAKFRRYAWGRGDRETRRRQVLGWATGATTRNLDIPHQTLILTWTDHARSPSGLSGRAQDLFVSATAVASVCSAIGGPQPHPRREAASGGRLVAAAMSALPLTAA